MDDVVRLIVEPTQDGRGIVGVWDVKSLSPERLAELRQGFHREFVYARDYDALKASVESAGVPSPQEPIKAVLREMELAAETERNEASAVQLHSWVRSLESLLGLSIEPEYSAASRLRAPQEKK